MNRIAKYGIPIDLTTERRSLLALHRLLPEALNNYLAEGALNARFDHALYGLKPKHGVFQQHPTVCDELPNRIACGSVIVKPNITGFTKHGVKFEDGTNEENIDHVIYATGYVFGFPFIDKSVIDVKDNEVCLYKYMFPPELAHPTLAVIGCFQPLGSIMPISELQCRWATRIFKVNF